MLAVAMGVSTVSVQTQDRPTIASMADFLRTMNELSNWGRWGADDELGAANFITPATRQAAAALVADGISVSLAHDIPQSESSGTILERVVFNVSPTGAFDRYAYTGTYHGTTHSPSGCARLPCHVAGAGVQRSADGGCRGRRRLSPIAYQCAQGRHLRAGHPV